LLGSAPSTVGYYVRADELALKVNHVLDAGCGSGEGLRLLSRRFRKTTGVDKDARALAFSRQLASEARIIQADLQTLTARTESPQVVYVVDVLGHLDRPERALRGLASRLSPPFGLFAAEPLARADQCLAFPVRRAFSMRGLHSLLMRSGFVVERWLDSDGTFLQAYAVSHRDPCVIALADAESHFERGALEAALELATRASRSTLMGLRLEAQLTRAHLLLELGRRDAATAVLLESRDLDSGDPRPLAALSRLAMLAGSDPQALELAKEAVRLDVLDVSGVCALGTVRRELEPRESLDAWLVAHALAPDHSGIALHLCEAALALDDCALAITVLERLRRYSPNPSSQHSIVLAWLLAYVGRPLQAELEARLAASLDPDAPELKDLHDFIRQLTSS
jgi:SAM-dependent methyltransferase